MKKTVSIILMVVIMTSCICVNAQSDVKVILDGNEVMFDIGQVDFALEVGNGQRLQFKTFPGNQPLFHAALGTDKENVAVFLALPEHFGQCNRRIDMACGTAAGKYDIHENSSRQSDQLLRVPSGHAKYNSHLHQLQHQCGAAVGEEGQRNAG